MIQTVKKPNPQKDSGINYDELWEFYPEFFDICSSINGGGYGKNSIEFCGSVLEALEDWDSITWPQFIGIFKIKNRYKNKFETYYGQLNGDEYFYARGSQILITKRLDKIPTTDYQIDKLIGPTHFYEFELGKKLSYTKFGERKFIYD